MERIFLYYPTIDIPKKEWLYNVVLYADKVSSILPNRDEYYLPDTVKYLRDQDQYSPVYINDLLKKYPAQFRKFEEKFLEAIDDDKFFSRSSDIPKDRRFRSIYNDKMTQTILYELDRRNLIQQQAEKNYLPENVAIFYMNVLAQFATEVNEQNNIIIPSTDYKRFSDITFFSRNSNNEAMNLVFENCLPMPDLNTSMDKVIDFKRKHRDDLLRFRQFLSNINTNLIEARDRTDINEILILTKEKIELELNTLGKIYKKNKIKTIITSIDSLLSLENPKLFESLLAVGILSTTINPAFGMGVAGIAVGVKLIDSFIENREKLQTNELNYLFEAKRQSLIK